MPNKWRCDRSSYRSSSFSSPKIKIASSKISSGKRIIPHVEHVDRSHQQRVDVYLFPGAAILSESKKEREREKNRGEGKKKQKYERWIIKIPLSGENDALEHECCSSLHHRSTVLPKFTIWPWASRIKPTLKRFDRQTTHRERERDEGMAVAKTIGNRRKINKERMGTKGRGGERRRGSNGRGRTRAIFPLFVFHYSAEGSCPLPAWNIARQ